LEQLTLNIGIRAAPGKTRRPQNSVDAAFTAASAPALEMFGASMSAANIVNQR